MSTKILTHAEIDAIIIKTVKDQGGRIRSRSLVGLLGAGSTPLRISYDIKNSLSRCVKNGTLVRLQYGIYALPDS